MCIYATDKLRKFLRCGFFFCRENNKIAAEDVGVASV